MFFALLALRPATAPLEPGPRLELWSRVLERFFLWVMAAIEVLPSAELQLALRPPSGRGRKRSVLLPFSSKTKLSSTIWPWRRDQTAGKASSMLGPIA